MLFRASTPTMPFPEMDGQQPPFASMFQTSGGMCSHVAASGATQHGSACNASSTNGYRGRVLYIPGLASVLTFCTQGGSPVPKSGPLGSVRGAGSNACPYRENAEQASKRTMRGPTRSPNRGSLTCAGGARAEAMIPAAAPGYWRQHVHKESARNTGNPKVCSAMSNRSPVRDGSGALGWRRGL